ncbi:MAG: polyprenyl P-hydroxybenzoate and phenylacrylic acid decarboxylase family protein [Bradyrhizobium sp.]|nr:polyprenyl P-hydroxybenzoate and phenylacrylic acid decarboxylase family protein [Bradyrhizobium sp.]
MYGQAALKALRRAGVETHLVVSRSAQITIAHELGLKISELTALADVVYRIDDIGAAISSGSFKTMGMIIAPCSIRTLSEIASGVTSSLLTRAADVVLKERRKLVLMVRETPLHLGHLRAMTQVTEIGAIVMPPVPAFYARPTSLEDIVNHSIGRALDLFGLESGLVPRWGETIGVGSSRNADPAG